MKIALIGYGKMGKMIEEIARSRGHEIVSIIDIDNQEEFESDAFGSADVAIEFTAPQAAYGNYLKAWARGVKVVSGSTGWMKEHGDDVRRACGAPVEGHASQRVGTDGTVVGHASKRVGTDDTVVGHASQRVGTDDTVVGHASQRVGTEGQCTLFWASNFSIGVAIFSAVNRFLAQIMNQFPQYDVKMEETHHIHKLDHPSGTAITLAEEIVERLDRKTDWEPGRVVQNGQTKGFVVGEASKLCSPAVGEASKLCSPAVSEASKLCSPAVNEASQLHSPVVGEASQLHSPAVSEASQLHNVVGEASKLCSPVVGEASKLCSPVVSEASQLCSPVVSEASQLHSPAVGEASKFPSPAVSEASQLCNRVSEMLQIDSIRVGEVPGIHTIKYDSPEDCITITHDAHSRRGFALGAVLAAEYTKEHQGLLTISDMFKF